MVAFLARTNLPCQTPITNAGLNMSLLVSRNGFVCLTSGKDGILKSFQSVFGRECPINFV
jgi:hypothetical protein